MKNIFRIYKRDLRSIATNWVAMVIILALIILPSLYAWFNIKASWDPYGNTDGIKVAIASEDVGTTFRDKEYNVGEQIIDKLRDNTAIGWQFVTKEVAEKGVLEGDYYASIVIPKDFSEDVLSLTTDNVINPKLEYKVNEKSNAIAPKITSSGVKSIKNEVSSNVVKTVNGVIFNIADELGINIRDSKGNIRKLINLLYELNDKMPEIENGINTADDGINTLEDVLGEVNDKMPTLSETLTSSINIINRGKGLLETTKGSLEKSSQDIKNKLIEAQKAIDSANKTLEKVDFSKPIKDIINGDKVNVDKSEVLDKSVNDILNDVKKAVEDSSKKIDDAIENLDKICDALDERGIDSTAVREKISELKKARENNSKVKEAINGVLAAVEEKQDKVKKIKELLPTVSSEVQKVNDSYDNIIVPKVKELSNQIDLISSNALIILNSAQDTLPKVNKLLGIAGEGTEVGKDTISLAKEELPTVKEKLSNLVEKIKSVDNEADIDSLLDLIINNPEVTSSFLSDPVQIEETRLFPVPNYGTGMSPFYTTLALWVGGTLLISLLTTSAHPLEEGVEITATEEYFGKGLTFLTVAVIQGLVATLGDVALLKVSVVHPVLFVFSGIFISVVFVTIVYTLVSVFGDVGKAVAIIFLVLQVAASGGTFPVEVMSSFFKMIHPLLPFKYAIGIMREFTAGIVPNLLFSNIINLSIFLIVFIIIGVTLKAFVNVHTRKLSHKLGESGIAGH
ncbi:MAG: YhgE/Pip domain-containing protein [Clostridium sp.]|nr:YhgE/Pip domain-containing protein [Clostridium sp.]